jgi:hypothetical protein
MANQLRCERVDKPMRNGMRAVELLRHGGGVP